MNQVYQNSLENSKMALTNFTCANGRSLLKDNRLYKIIWAKVPIANLTIDGCVFKLEENQMVFCTPLNILEIPLRHKRLMSIVFNREFFCIHDKDIEVSCNGLLFFGSSSPILVDLQSIEEQEAFNGIYNVLTKELDVKDNIQGEMLRAILKRLLIKSTRLAKKQIILSDLSQDKIDLIRKFNILVEKHFKTHHQVGEYATMLYKSPKTLSNTFSKHSRTSPLKIIHQRLILEARRLLLFSGKSVLEISCDLGFEDESYFCKFFARNMGLSPLEFKKEKLTEHIGKNLPK